MTPADIENYLTPAFEQAQALKDNMDKINARAKIKGTPQVDAPDGSDRRSELSLEAELPASPYTESDTDSSDVGSVGSTATSSSCNNGVSVRPVPFVTVSH